MSAPVVTESPPESLRAHRPLNVARSVFHLGAALAALLLLEVVLSTRGSLIATGAFAAMCWTLETTRRRSAALNRWLMTSLGPIAHAHEAQHVNSATWYSTALVLLALTRTPMTSALALTVLGVADPLAALVGRRFGRIRIVGSRTLEGSLTFVVTGTAAALVTLAIFHAEVRWPTSLGVAAGAALLGAVCEAYSRVLDDNFTVPLGAAAGAAIASLALGVPL